MHGTVQDHCPRALDMVGTKHLGGIDKQSLKATRDIYLAKLAMLLFLPDLLLLTA